MEFFSILGSLVLVFIVLLIIKANIQKSEVDSKKTNLDSLYYIGLVITLCISVSAFLSIIFSIIDKLMPDAITSYGTYYQPGMPSEIAMMIATLIIVFPLFILFSYLIDKDIKRDPSKKDLTLRKAVIYLALIVSAISVISIIIATIYSFLMGSLLNVFLIKATVAFLISVFLFAYYYYSLDRNYESSTNVPMILSIFALLVILATIIFSINTFGNPSKVRDLSMDNNKVTDLNTISYSISNFYSQNNKLPENLNIIGFDSLKDRDTGASYEYNIMSASSSQYSLCATFKRDVNYGNDYNLSKWSHPAGNYCFSLNALQKQY